MDFHTLKLRSGAVFNFDGHRVELTHDAVVLVHADAPADAATEQPTINQPAGKGE